MRFLEEEIDLWFTSIVEKAVQKFKKKIIYSKVDLKQVLFEQLTGLSIEKQHIERVLEEVGIEDVKVFARRLRELSKPMLIAANKIDLPKAPENYEKLKKEFPHYIIIPTCAEGEIALKKASRSGLIEYEEGDGFRILKDERLNERQREALRYIKERVIDKFGSTGVQQALNDAVFKLLKYIVVYPVANATKLTDTKGNVLPDAFLVPSGTTLKEFAYKIHTDIAERFIGGIDARTKRKLSADYVLRHNDVVEILFRK